MNYIAELLKNERSTYTPSQKGQKGQKPESETIEEKNIAAPYTPSQKGQKGQKRAPNAATVHRWAEATQAPDARQLAREVTLARVGQWLTPTPALMAIWRAFNAHFGANLSSQQVGAIARQIDADPGMSNNELLDQIAALLRQGETP